MRSWLFNRYTYLVCVWGGTALGVMLLSHTVETMVWIGLITVAFFTVVLTTAWKEKAVRVIGRVLCLLAPVAFAVLFGMHCIECLSVVKAGAELDPTTHPATVLALVGTPLFCVAVPGAVTVANKGNRYDGWVARVIYTVQTVLCGYCCFGTPAEFLVWHWQTPVARYIWVALTAAGYVLCWVHTYRRGKEKAEP